MNPLWLPAPTTFDLHEGDVHVWTVSLVQPPHVEATLSETLSADERERADRFHFTHDRQHYVVGRGILRQLLERYSGTAAKAIQFSYNPQGKPALVDNSVLQFNVSNSRDVALIALTLHQRIGVDVEYRRTLSDMIQVARSSFSANEFQQFMRLPAEIQPEAFFNCWTRKEAYIKAIGEGLSHPLDSFDVAFVPDTTPRFLRIARDEQAVERWSLRALEPHADYTAALAVDGSINNLMYWQWQPSV
jgi:4'-phosphopantetheinyl transferase